MRSAAGLAHVPPGADLALVRAAAGLAAAPPATGRAAAPLALGFAAAAAMWAVGYVCRLPGSQVPGAAVLGLLAGCMLAAGVAAGRYAGSVRIGALAGAVTGLINLLVLGSLLRDPHSEQFNRLALLWAPGSILACALVASVGAAIGRAFGLARRTIDTAETVRALGGTVRRQGASGDARASLAAHSPAINWRCTFACVAAATTVILIVAGGVVTGFEAGLAVPDWPASYGYNMFLYPLARMTGGIYFEHTHRLFGSLVGLTTLTLTIYLLASRTPALHRWVAVLALAGVIVQGVLGGFRVTETNIALAITHGILAQLFLATLFLLAAMLTETWRAAAPEPHAAAATDRTLGAIAVPALVIQLMLGALLRHTPSDFWLVLHIASAVVVIGLVGLYATRVWAIYESQPVLTRLGGVVLTLLSVQLMLGFAALFAVSLDAPGRPDPVQVLLTTAHQTTGALLLASTGLLVLWQARLTTPVRGFAVVPATNGDRASA